MRTICLLLCLFAFSCFALSQSLQKVPLRSVISDLTNEFQNFRGPLKEIQTEDSTYYTNAVIEGSKDNEIEVIGGRIIQYHAYIADSANRMQAKGLVEKWKGIIKAIAPDYELVQVNYTNGKRVTTGYRFMKLSKILASISIVFSKREIDNYYWVLLTITRQGREVVTDEKNEEF